MRFMRQADINRIDFSNRKASTEQIDKQNLMGFADKGERQRKQANRRVGWGFSHDVCHGFFCDSLIYVCACGVFFCLSSSSSSSLVAVKLKHSTGFGRWNELRLQKRNTERLAKSRRQIIRFVSFFQPYSLFRRFSSAEACANCTCVWMWNL